MAAGTVDRIWAALTRVCEAWNSASAWMTLARRSRSASACLAMARTMFSVSSTVLISTLVTLIPEDRTQGRLREHDRRRKVSLNLDDGPFGIDDVEVKNRVNLHRDIVVGD